MATSSLGLNTHVVSMALYALNRSRLCKVYEFRISKVLFMISSDCISKAEAFTS